QQSTSTNHLLSQLFQAKSPSSSTTQQSNQHRHPNLATSHALSSSSSVNVSHNLNSLFAMVAGSGSELPHAPSADQNGLIHLSDLESNVPASVSTMSESPPEDDSYLVDHTKFLKHV